MRLKSFITVLLGSSISANYVSAQTFSPQVINTAGGSAVVNNTRVDWSIGELPLVGTMQNVIVITNGLIQPLTELNESNNSSTFGPEEVKVSPNPATTFLDINILTRQQGRLSIRLYNSMGQLAYQKEINSTGIGIIERIDMQALSVTEYFLSIILEPSPGSTRKSGHYKIIKVR